MENHTAGPNPSQSTDTSEEDEPVSSMLDKKMIIIKKQQTLIPSPAVASTSGVVMSKIVLQTPTVLSNRLVKASGLVAPAKRMQVKTIDITTQYQLFIRAAFPKEGIPPVIYYEKVIRQGTRVHRLIAPDNIEPTPSKNEHWIMVRNKMELSPTHRTKIKQWLSVDFEEKSMLICIRK